MDESKEATNNIMVISALALFDDVLIFSVELARLVGRIQPRVHNSFCIRDRGRCMGSGHAKTKNSILTYILKMFAPTRPA